MMRLDATTAAVIGVPVAIVFVVVGFFIGKGGNDGNPVGPVHYLNTEQAPLSVQNSEVISECLVDKKPCSLELFLTTTISPRPSPTPKTCESLSLSNGQGCYSFDYVTNSENDHKPVSLSGTVVVTPVTSKTKASPSPAGKPRT
jgi:hypothetical protein